MLNANDRPHWAQKAKITAYLRQIGRLKVSEGKYTTYTKKRPCGLVVTIYAPTKRRMDPPNFYPTVKALVDGMTDAGLWTDDNHEIIKYSKNPIPKAFIAIKQNILAHFVNI